MFFRFHFFRKSGAKIGCLIFSFDFARLHVHRVPRRDIDYKKSVHRSSNTSLWSKVFAALLPLKVHAPTANSKENILQPIPQKTLANQGAAWSALLKEEELQQDSKISFAALVYPNVIKFPLKLFSLIKKPWVKTHGDRFVLYHINAKACGFWTLYTDFSPCILQLNIAKRSPWSFSPRFLV